MAEYKLIQGDCIEVMKSMAAKSIDLCITSPPYNLGIDYNGQNDYLEIDDYYKWCETWIREIYRLLKDNGRFALNHYFSAGGARRRFAPLMKLNEISTNIGFIHHGVAFWNDITISKRTAWGSWLSASAPYVNSPYEGILILHKGEWNIGKGISDISKEEFMEATSGVWNLTTEKNRLHPAPFPVSLPLRCMKLLSFVGATILDPFSGSGTTGVACIQTGRDYIGIELNTDYIEMSRKRLDNTLDKLIHL